MLEYVSRDKMMRAQVIQTQTAIQIKPSLQSFFHTSSTSLARFPALQTKISRHAHLKNMRKIEGLKKKLGKDYKIIGRDKRMSPYSERNSPSKPSQPPPPKTPLKLADRFLISESNPVPVDFVPGDLGKASVEEEAIRIAAATKLSGNSRSSSSGNSISMPSASAFSAIKEGTDNTTLLKLPPVVIPKKTKKIPEFAELEYKTQSKPFYQYNLTPSETEFLFKEVPFAVKNTYSIIKDNSEQQSEMLRRIIMMENGNAHAKRKFNTARVVEMLQQHPLDTGSAQVQAGAMSIKISAMRNHLSRHKKDKSTKRKFEYWVSKQRKMLQYLRRKNLRACVSTCEFIGVDPTTV